MGTISARDFETIERRRFVGLGREHTYTSDGRNARGRVTMSRVVWSAAWGERVPGALLKVPHVGPAAAKLRELRGQPKRPTSGPAWGWSVSYETATIARGTAGTHDEARTAAAVAETIELGRGLDPDKLAWHVGEVR